jgi:hypothetical protein
MWVLHTSVCTYARNYARGFFRGVEMSEHGKLSHCFCKVRFANDRVSSIDCLGEMASQLHSDAPRYSSPLQIADCRPSGRSV